MGRGITRRQLFRLDLGAILAGVHAGDGEARPVVRPPGALADEAVFVATCRGGADGCRACSAACSYGVVYHLGPEAGAAEGTPHMEPVTSPCHWCPTMDCVGACPTGALRLGPGESPRPIGTARLDLAACLTAQGILCDECATACPPQVRAVTVRFGRTPVLDADRCVGCGLCAFHCAAVPAAIAIEAAPR